MKASVVILVLTFLVAGCDNSRKGIVGKWKVQGQANDVVWEFQDNGVVTTAGAPGRYSFGDGDRIKIQTQFATFVHQFELQDDRMTWKDPSGTKTELIRIK